MAKGNELLTLQEASDRIGVGVSSLREQAQKGVLRATKKGNTWLVYAKDADTYARDHRGKVGRPRKPSAK